MVVLPVEGVGFVVAVVDLGVVTEVTLLLAGPADSSALAEKNPLFVAASLSPFLTQPYL